MSRINGFVGRRDLLKLLGVGGVGVATTAAGSVLVTAQQTQAVTPPTAEAPRKPQPASANDRPLTPQPVSPDAALKRLLDGNKRFAQQKPLYPDQTLARLQLVAQGQRPFAVLLSCSDSRVPSEIVFDQGLGDLFVARVAGNVVTPEITGSLEYATAVLGSQLIVVLGHRRCGAVGAAVAGELLPGRISSFVEDIKPSLARVKGKPGDAVDNAVIANVQYQVEKLKENSTVLDNLIQSGNLKIVGGRYDLDTGLVTIVT